VLQDGGTFEVCQLCGDLPSDQNEERATSPAAESQFFRAYKDILDLMGINVLWQLAKKYLPSVNLLRGPATLFQVTVWETQHMIKHQGLQQCSPVGGLQVQISPEALLCGLHPIFI
jgi:hypothetical protein